MNSGNYEDWTDTDDESDNESDDEFDIADNHQPMMAKGNSLAIIAKWNPEFGLDENSSPDIKSHWLIMDIIDVKDFYGDLNEIQDTLRFYRHHSLQGSEYIQLNLITYQYLNGQEFVAVSKLYWIKLVQRTWKKIFKERKEKITMRKSPKELQYRAIHGCWAPHVNYLPGLRSMIKV